MIKLLLLLLLFSCSDEITKSDSMDVVKNLIVNVDRTNNEIYVQVETASNLSSDIIDSVTVHLEYAGGIGIDYSNSFVLYDDGTNGDIIASNGIYTLIDSADQVSIPDEQAEIVNVNFPTYFVLNQTESGIIPFSVTIRGKKYLATVNIFVGNSNYTYAEYINVDNTSLEIQINKKDLYIDDANTEVCDRVANTYGDIFYPIAFDWPDASSTGFNNYFTYESGFSVVSMSDCASTGISIFKFILNDLDNGQSASYEKSIVMYGCGDGICESDYENNLSCSEDCSDE
jgi:hypothetical protein